MRDFIHKLVLGTVICCVASSCKHNEEPRPEPIPEGEHTVIVYMVADNNLSSYAVNNINDMEKSFNDELGARMLVFYNQRSGGNEIIEIQKDNTEKIASKTLKEYSDDLNPCLPATLEQVIADCRELSPSKHYSIIFWSHGSGWLPKGMSPAKTEEKPDYSFGLNYQYTDVLEVNELAAALPDDLVFEFIHFDACHMGSIEVAYELRNKAKYLIASPAEILAAGYPYALAMDELLTYDAVGIAKTFYDDYNSQSGVYQSATIGVTDLSELTNVAAKFKAMVASGDEKPIAEQQYGRYLGSSSDYRDLMWDMSDMAKRTYGTDRAADFLAALDKAVIYKAATPYIFYGDPYGTIAIKEFSGLSLYLPRSDEIRTLEIYVRDYQWARDTEFANTVQ